MAGVVCRELAPGDAQRRPRSMPLGEEYLELVAAHGCSGLALRWPHRGDRAVSRRGHSTQSIKLHTSATIKV